MIPRLFVNQPLSEGHPVTLDGDPVHYLKNVLRRGPGDELGLFNGRDGEWLGRIESYGRHGATIRLDGQRREQAASPDLWLAFAPIKRARIDLIAEKATELGVSVLLPVMTRRSEPMRVNIERLTNIAIEAAEQTERLDIPEVREAASLDRLLSEWPRDRVLFVCAEAGNASPIAPVELDALRKLPFVVPVGLGPRLLRAETAVIAALACWQALAGDGATAESRPPFRREFVS